MRQEAGSIEASMLREEAKHALCDGDIRDLSLGHKDGSFLIIATQIINQ